MLQVVDDVIFLTKGDNESLPVNVVVNGNEPYKLGENEFLRLIVRELPNEGSQLIFEAESNPGSDKIIIPAAATSGKEPVKYSAAIRLIDGTDNQRTVWPDNTTVKPNDDKSFNNFWLTPEVPR